MCVKFVIKLKGGPNTSSSNHAQAALEPSAPGKGSIPEDTELVRSAGLETESVSKTFRKCCSVPRQDFLVPIKAD